MKKKTIAIHVLLILILVCFLFPLLSFTQKYSEKEDIRKVALNYIEGAFSADSERFISALHPEVNKVKPTTIPGTNKEYLRKSGYSMLEEVVRAKGAFLPENQREISIEVMDIVDSIASVKITSTSFIDYCQMAKLNGEWKIVNVLWIENTK